MPLGMVGGVLQHGGRREALMGKVGPHPVEDGHRVGGGFDAGDIQFGKRLGVAEDRL